MSHEARVRTENLSFRYRPNSPDILSDLSVEFPAGTTTAITGPSGSGKSTLLYLLGLLLRPTGGHIWFGDTAMNAAPDRARSSVRNTQVGFVFQDSLLDPARSVADNIIEPTLYGPSSRRHARSRVNELLASVGLGDLDPARRPGEISGGQGQRIALCRAVIQDPPIILADEPTGNLDENTARLVLEVLSSEADNGRCVIVVTHNSGLAASCDRRIDLGAETS